MERLILDYTVTGQHTLTLNNADAFSQFTKDNIRLIIDCTTQEPIVTPLDRTALDSVAYSSGTHKLTITLKSTSPVLTVGGELSVKIDDGIKYSTDYAKEKTLTNLIPIPIINVRDIEDGTNVDFVYDGQDTYTYPYYFKWRNDGTYLYTETSVPNNRLYIKNGSTYVRTNDYDFNSVNYLLLHDIVNQIKNKTDYIGTPSDASVQGTLFGKLADIKGSIPSTSTLAKEATLGTSNDTAANATIFGKIANLLSTWNTWISGAWATLVSNVTAIKAKTDNIGTPSDTSSASTLFGKVAAIPTTQITDYAKQGSNPDINFTTLNAKMDTVIGTGITEITTQAITEIVNRVKAN